MAVLLLAAATAACGTGGESDAETVALAASQSVARSGPTPEPSDLGTRATDASMPSPQTTSPTASTSAEQATHEDPPAAPDHATATTGPATTTTVPFGDIPRATFVGLTDRDPDGEFQLVGESYMELRIEGDCLYLMVERGWARNYQPIEKQQLKFNFTLPKANTGYDPATESLYSYTFDEKSRSYKWFGPMQSGDMIETAWVGSDYDPDPSSTPTFDVVRETCPADGWANALYAEPVTDVELDAWRAALGLPPRNK